MLVITDTLLFSHLDGHVVGLVRVLVAGVEEQSGPNHIGLGVWSSAA